MEQIAHYTRRPMEAEDLFVFSMILCDNEIDRDGECFTAEALERLAELYRGKSGVLDHQPTAVNQSARIFDTALITNGSNSMGEPYTALKAYAYMVRCDKNKDFILEIDAGIKKEVSVGCAVEQVCCSVCGSNQKELVCGHTKGMYYEGMPCYHKLQNPTDAYEWSFVAVPAQPQAGVTKQCHQHLHPALLWERIEKAQSSVTLSPQETQLLQKQMQHLTHLAKQGAAYQRELQGEIIRLAAFAQPELESRLLEQMCKNLTVPELISLRQQYRTLNEGKGTILCQLAATHNTTKPANQTPYRI